MYENLKIASDTWVIHRKGAPDMDLFFTDKETGDKVAREMNRAYKSGAESVRQALRDLIAGR